MRVARVLGQRQEVFWVRREMSEEQRMGHEALFFVFFLVAVACETEASFEGVRQCQVFFLVSWSASGEAMILLPVS